MNWAELSEAVFYALGTVAIVTGVVRYMYNWLVDYEESQAMTREIAYTHLPFIYAALQAICVKLDVHLDPAPVISRNPKRRWLRKERQAQTPRPNYG